MNEAPQVKTEVLLPDMDEPAYDICYPNKNKGENLQTKLNTDVKEENSSIQIKSEAPDLECSNTTYDDATIKLKVLDSELDLKTEILNNHDDQVINEPSEIRPFLHGLENFNCKRENNVLEYIDSPTGESTLEHPSIFVQERSFLQHEQRDTEEKRFKCDRCPYLSDRKRNLAWHMKTHTSKKSFKCSVCNYASVVRYNLEQHMKIHSEEKPFKCNMCSYASVWRGNLEVHVKTHTGEKPFKCSVCDYASVDKHSLERHVKIHTGEKPFQCDVCSYASADKRNLKRHMKIHTGQKSFKNNARKYSDVKSNLQQHMKTDSAEKRFKCTGCSYASNVKCNLQKHMKTQH